MKKKRLVIRTILLFLFFCAICYTLYVSQKDKQNNSNLVDNKAPNFSLESVTNEKYVLADLKGKGVIVNFWGTWCEPCAKEMPILNKIHNEYKNKGIEVLTVNAGESDLAVENYAEQLKLTLPILMDKSGDVQEAYRVQALPVTFVINKKGIVVHKFVGELTEDILQSFVNEIKP